MALTPMEALEQALELLSFLEEQFPLSPESLEIIQIIRAHLLQSVEAIHTVPDEINPLEMLNPEAWESGPQEQRAAYDGQTNPTLAPAPIGPLHFQFPTAHQNPAFNGPQTQAHPMHPSNVPAAAAHPPTPPRRALTP